MKGRLLEDSLRSHPRGMGLRRTLGEPRLVERDEVESWLEVAGLDPGTLVAAANPALADLVLEGVDPQDGTALALVVEASWKVDRSDVERAKARAETLARAGHRSRGAVAGRLIDDHAGEEAEAGGVTAFVSPGP